MGRTAIRPGIWRLQQLADGRAVGGVLDQHRIRALALPQRFQGLAEEVDHPRQIEAVVLAPEHFDPVGAVLFWAGLGWRADMGNLRAPAGTAVELLTPGRAWATGWRASGSGNRPSRQKPQ